MRVIVCGGRDYEDIDAVFAALDRIHAKRVLTHIAQGGAAGADALAESWAKKNGVECTTYEADWKAFKKAAGPIRNQWMLDTEMALGAEGLIAFPGSSGTADMAARAEAAGLPVWRPT